MDSKFPSKNRLTPKRKTSLQEKTHLGIRVMQRNIFEKEQLAKKLQKYETEMQGKMKHIEDDLKRIRDFQRNLEIASPYESETRWLMEMMSRERMQSTRRKVSVPLAWPGGSGYQGTKQTDIDEAQINLDNETEGVGISNKTLHHISTDLSNQHQMPRLRAKTATEGMLEEAHEGRTKTVVRRQTLPKTKKEQISVDNFDNMKQNTEIIHRKFRNMNLQEEEDDVFTDDSKNGKIDEKSHLNENKQFGLVYDKQLFSARRPRNGAKYPVGGSARLRRCSASIVYPTQSQHNVTDESASNSNQVMRRRLSLSTFGPRPPTVTSAKRSLSSSSCAGPL